MASRALTDRFCSTAKPEAGAAQTDYFDKVAPGLSLRVSAGGTRSWYAMYRKPDGRKARAKLGSYPDLSLSVARSKARDLRVAIADGRDLEAEARAEAAAPTVRDLIGQYLARRVAGNRSAGKVEQRLRNNVEPLIGDVKLAKLTRKDLTKCVDAVVDRGAATMAVRLFADLRAMVRWARGRGDLSENLVEGMRSPAEPAARERVLSGGELATMLGNLPAADLRPATRRILLLCLLLGQRVSEMSGIRLDELDLEGGLLSIRASRMKNGLDHAVPLPDSAVSIIRQQMAELEVKAARDRKHKRHVPDSFEFLFPGFEFLGSATGQSVAKALRRLQTDGRSPTILGIAPFTPHDLRRTAATGMEELGISPFVIAHVLGHISVTKASVTTKHYARHDYLAEKRAALDVWAERIASLMREHQQDTPRD